MHPSYHLLVVSPSSLDVEYFCFPCGFQCLPVYSCSTASCDLGDLAGEDEHKSFYSTILNQSHRSYSFLQCTVFSLQWVPCCRAQAPDAWTSVVATCGSWSVDSAVVVHGLRCSTVCGIFPDQLKETCQRVLTEKNLYQNT